MTPQKKRAFLFLLLMIVISAGIIVWSLRINRGMLIIFGEAPFSIGMNGLKNIVCQTSPCQISLRPNQYNLVGKKEGYFDERFSAQVRLWGETEAQLYFQFIPAFLENVVYTPHEKLKRFEGNGLDFGPSFNWNDIDLSKIPNGAKKVIFSPSGRNAVVFLGKEIYLFTHKAGKEAFLVALDVPDFEQIAFTASEQMLLLTKFDEGNPEEKQKLILADPQNPNQQTVVTSFEKIIGSPALLATQDRAILIEQTEEEQRAYGIFLSQKQKRRLELPITAKNIRLLSDQWMVYEEKNDVFLRSLADGKEISIASISARHVLMMDSARILFISEQSSETRETSGVSFEEFTQMAAENLEALKTLESGGTGVKLKWYFVQLNIEKGLDQMALKDLATHSHGAGESIEVFPLQSSTEGIDFLKHGEIGAMILTLKL